jgi:hypothetical protein
VVKQDTFLLAGTVLENTGHSTPEGFLHEVIRVSAKIANARAV